MMFKSAMRSIMTKSLASKTLPWSSYVLLYSISLIANFQNIEVLSFHLLILSRLLNSSLWDRSLCFSSSITVSKPKGPITPEDRVLLGNLQVTGNSPRTFKLRTSWTFSWTEFSNSTITICLDIFYLTFFIPRGPI